MSRLRTGLIVAASLTVGALFSSVSCEVLKPANVVTEPEPIDRRTKS